MCEIKPCINPNCVDGWDTGRPAPAVFAHGRESYLRGCVRLRCCTACGGRGYLAGERDNRRHYYEMRAIAAELECGRPDNWDIPLPIAAILPESSIYPTVGVVAEAFEALTGAMCGA